MKVIEILKAHLVAGGFDGLVQEAAECGCELGDLVPCTSDFSECEPAYRRPDPDDKDGWLMCAKRPGQAPRPEGPAQVDEHEGATPD
jgi:hypothetical protein